MPAASNIPKRPLKYSRIMLANVLFKRLCSRLRKSGISSVDLFSVRGPGGSSLPPIREWNVLNGTLLSRPRASDQQLDLRPWSSLTDSIYYLISISRTLAGKSGRSFSRESICPSINGFPSAARTIIPDFVGSVSSTRVFVQPAGTSSIFPGPAAESFPSRLPELSH